MRKPEPTPEPVEEPVSEPIPEPTPEPVVEKKSAKDYSIPDPGDDLRVVDYGKRSEKPKYTRQASVILSSIHRRKETASRMLSLILQCQ